MSVIVFSPRRMLRSLLSSIAPHVQEAKVSMRSTRERSGMLMIMPSPEDGKARRFRSVGATHRHLADSAVAAYPSLSDPGLPRPAPDPGRLERALMKG